MLHVPAPFPRSPLAVFVSSSHPFLFYFSPITSFVSPRTGHSMPRLNNFAQKNATQHELARARKANTNPAAVKRISQKKKRKYRLLRLHKKAMFAGGMPAARREEPAAIIPADLELKGCCLGGGRSALQPITSNELRLRVPTRNNRDADPEWSSTCDKGASNGAASYNHRH
jgi:hypothetical protein